MSVEQLKLIDDDGAAQLVISNADDNFMLVVDAVYNPHSSILDLDRSQAHLLYLFLKERFDAS